MTGGSLLDRTGGDGAAVRMSGTGTLASEGAPMGEKPPVAVEGGADKEGREEGDDKEEVKVEVEGETADAPAEASDTDKPVEDEGSDGAEGDGADTAEVTDKVAETMAEEGKVKSPTSLQHHPFCKRQLR